MNCAERTDCRATDDDNVLFSCDGEGSETRRDHPTRFDYPDGGGPRRTGRLAAVVAAMPAAASTRVATTVAASSVGFDNSLSGKWSTAARGERQTAARREKESSREFTVDRIATVIMGFCRKSRKSPIRPSIERDLLYCPTLCVVRCTPPSLPSSPFPSNPLISPRSPAGSDRNRGLIRRCRWMTRDFCSPKRARRPSDRPSVHPLALSVSPLSP